MPIIIITVLAQSLCFPMVSSCVISNRHWPPPPVVGRRSGSSRGRRRDRIRPCPGWHPCAESSCEGSSSSSSSSSSIENDRGSGSSTTTAVVMNDETDEIIIGASSSASASLSSRYSPSLNTGGDENLDDNDNTRSNIRTNNKNNENNIDLEQTKKSQLTAILILLTVPAAWGTYAPAVKYIYDVAPSDSNQPSMPGLVFSAGYYCVAALTLGLLSYWRDHRQADDDEDATISECKQRNTVQCSRHGESSSGCSYCGR